MAYSAEEIFPIYELGRMYYEMGFFAPAERIFLGLTSIDEGRTAARLALGLVKLETGLLQESEQWFRLELQHGSFPLQAKLALVAAFLAAGDLPRSRTLLGEIKKALDDGQEVDPDVRALFEAFALRITKERQPAKAVESSR